MPNDGNNGSFAGKNVPDEMHMFGTVLALHELLLKRRFSMGTSKDLNVYTVNGSLHAGISLSNKWSVIEVMTKVLADTYYIYLKTQNYHWNVTGSNFLTLHILFEEQYTQLAEAVDIIAERLRSLGAHAPGSFSEFLRLTSFQEEEDVATLDVVMLERLASANEFMIKELRDYIIFLNNTNDESTKDILIHRLKHHEKNVWFLRSFLI